MTKKYQKYFGIISKFRPRKLLNYAPNNWQNPNQWLVINVTYTGTITVKMTKPFHISQKSCPRANRLELKSFEALDLNFKP